MANCLCPDQTAPEGAVGSGSTLFAPEFKIITVAHMFCFYEKNATIFITKCEFQLKLPNFVSLA